MKLKNKILIPSLIIIIISISCTGVLGYVKGKNMILQQLYKEGDNQLNLLVKAE